MGVLTRDSDSDFRDSLHDFGFLLGTAYEISIVLGPSVCSGLLDQCMKLVS